MFVFPHTPILQKLSNGVIFKIYIVRSMIERAMFAPHPRIKVFARLFQKAAEAWARSPCRPPQRAKFSCRSTNAGEGEFLCRAKKEGEPSSGVLPCFVGVCIRGGRKLKKFRVMWIALLAIIYGILTELGLCGIILCEIKLTR